LFTRIVESKEKWSASTAVALGELVEHHQVYHISFFKSQHEAELSMKTGHKASAIKNSPD
jgi:hypothetical protein